MSDNNKGILDFKCFVPEPVQTLIELLQNQEVQAFLKLFIDNSIATSELKILKRLADIEKALGLNGFSDFEEEHEQTIPEQLSLLAERIDNLTESVEKSIVSPKTVTETRASLLVDHMKRIKPAAEGEVFLSHYGIVSFLKHEIQEEYRADKVKNIRQVKKEVLEKARELYSDRVSLSKSEHGRREVRIVLRPSEDRQSLRMIQREVADVSTV